MANIPFIAECSKILSGMKNRTVITPEGDYYKSSTITNISNKVNCFKDYEIFLQSEIKLSDINFEWCEYYRLYLLDKGYSKNTVSAILSVLKAFLKRMYNAGMTTFSGSGIRTPTEVTTAVFNTVDELKSLYSLDFSANPGRERIRDIYVLQSFLGLRVSDMFDLLSGIKIRMKFINQTDFIEIKTNKNGEVVVIPLAKIAVKIMESRKYDFGKRFSEQYYRKELKLLFSLSGMDREVLFNRTEGGVRVERTVLFSNLLGTHSARRSFATNAYLAGINPLDIMKITGHKTFSAFLRYIRCENMAVALRISEHEFFKIDI